MMIYLPTRGGILSSGVEYTPPAPWTPADLAVAPVVWIDAQALVGTFADGAAMSSITDRVGMTHNAYSGDPLMAYSQINGNAAISFNIASATLTAGLESASNVTVVRGAMYAVWRNYSQTGTSPYPQFFSSHGTLAEVSTNGFYAWGLGNQAVNHARSGSRRALGTATAWDTISTWVTVDAGSKSGIGPYIRKNGVTLTTTPVYDAESVTFDGSLAKIWHTGGCHNTGFRPRGHLAEIIKLGYEPTPTEHAFIMGYLSERYGYGPSRYLAAVLADAPVALWRLNEVSGTTAADSVGSHVGTIGGSPTMNQPGPTSDGASILFGSGKYVTSPDTNDLTPASLSVEFWVKLPSALAAQAGFITKYEGSQRSWAIQTEASSPYTKLWFTVSSSTGSFVGFRVETNAGTLPADNAWHHVVCTVGTASAPVIYIDGVSQTLTTVAGTAAATTPANNDRLLIFGNGHDGAGTNTPGTPFAGYMSEVAVYNTILSAASVAAHYAAG